MLLGETNRRTYSLQELTSQVRSSLLECFPETYWVRAETSDVRINASSGHCYLEFVEKNPMTNQLVAKAKASIWAKTFRMLKPYFEMETKQPFTSGIKVLVCVTVEFHELYGFSLNVVDIDPTYTLGDMAKKRLKIINQLKEEGVFTLNKELPLPVLPKRIAVVTSPTAAGYEDFMNQLMHNQAGYPFYVKLFPAWMQGERTETSIIEALERIDEHRELFDVVVIIRGGGATSDLNSFDSYLLAANCAQFPLPIITGIGHERDDTIVDLVAHTRLKTPTAVAAFLIGCMDKAAVDLEELQHSLCEDTRNILQEKKRILQMVATRFPSLVTGSIEKRRSMLQLISGKLPVITPNLLAQQQNQLDSLLQRIRISCDMKLTKENRFIELQEQFVRMASPEYILKRGYSLTLRDGKIVKSATRLKPEDSVSIRFSDGEVAALVKEVKPR